MVYLDFKNGAGGRPSSSSPVRANWSASGLFILHRRQNGYITGMSYLTLEVEIDHGKVVAKGVSKLPEKASGLLTIFQSDAAEPARLSPLQALEALQKHLRLDAQKAADWMTTAREARR